MLLKVGEPVARDDGRFYVPVIREGAEPNVSDIILRVASDAFFTLDAAKRAAKFIVDAVNSHGEAAAKEALLP